VKLANAITCSQNRDLRICKLPVFSSWLGTFLWSQTLFFFKLFFKLSSIKLWHEQWYTSSVKAIKQVAWENQRCMHLQKDLQLKFLMNISNNIIVFALITYIHLSVIIHVLKAIHMMFLLNNKTVRGTCTVSITI